MSLMETQVPFSSTDGSPRLDIRTETENPKDNCVRAEWERGTLCLRLSYVLLLHFENEKHFVFSQQTLQVKICLVLFSSFDLVFVFFDKSPSIVHADFKL